MRDCRNECTIKNSFNFGEEVANFDYKRFMTISDVKSFLNNINLNETINNYVEDLLINNSYDRKFSQIDYKRLITRFNHVRRSFCFHFLVPQLAIAQSYQIPSTASISITTSLIESFFHSKNQYINLVVSTYQRFLNVLVYCAS